MNQSPHVGGGPPYVNTSIASLGGRPKISQDVPVLAVLLACYIGGAVANMTIFQLNQRRGHKFLMQIAMFGFCMSRIATCVLRIAWTAKPTNARLAIAAQIFTNAGILVVYIVVLLLSLRIFRATHPSLGWNRPFRKVLIASYVVLLVALLLVIAFTVLSLYTLNTTLRSVALWVQRGAILYMLLFNILSLVLYLLSVLLPRASNNENFGTGSMGLKMAILGIAVFFINFIAGFRTATIWTASRPASNPGWYQTKPAFYVIIFAFEIIIVYLFIVTRFDRRFWVPNGSCKPGDYSQIENEDSTLEKNQGKETVKGSV